MILTVAQYEMYSTIVSQNRLEREFYKCTIVSTEARLSASNPSSSRNCMSRCPISLLTVFIYMGDDKIISAHRDGERIKGIIMHTALK